jgi:hypothetical protein
VRPLHMKSFAFAESLRNTALQNNTFEVKIVSDTKCFMRHFKVVCNFVAICESFSKIYI